MTFPDLDKRPSARIQARRAEAVDMLRRELNFWGSKQLWANVPDTPETRTIRAGLRGERASDADVGAAWAWLSKGGKV